MKPFISSFNIVYGGSTLFAPQNKYAFDSSSEVCAMLSLEIYS